MEVRSLGQGDPLEAGMATHSSILAWRIPWTEEPRGPWSMGSHRVTHYRGELARAHSGCYGKIIKVEIMQAVGCAFDCTRKRT